MDSEHLQIKGGIKLKQIATTFENEYEMSDQIPVDKAKRIRISGDIVQGFKDLVNRHEPYQKILKMAEDLENKKRTIKDEAIREVISEKITSLENKKKFYERIRNRALDLSFFSYSDEKGNAISEIKIVEGKNALFQDVFGKNARIDGIIQTAVMGQGMGMRAENDEYEIHMINPLKGIKASIKFED